MRPKEFAIRLAEATGWKDSDVQHRCRRLIESRRDLMPLGRPGPGGGADIEAQHAINLDFGIVGTPLAVEAHVAAAVYKDLLPTKIIGSETVDDKGRVLWEDVSAQDLDLLGPKKTLGEMLTTYVLAAGKSEESRELLVGLFKSVAIHQSTPVARLKLRVEEGLYYEQEYRPSVSDNRVLLTGWHLQQSPFRAVTTLGLDLIFIVADILAGSAVKSSITEEKKVANA